MKLENLIYEFLCKENWLFSSMEKFKITAFNAPFVICVIGYGFSIFDVSTDYFSAFSLIEGNNYTKRVTGMEDSSVASNNSNCTFMK